MHKLSTVNNQDSSGKAVKALGVQCGGPWFKFRLVLGCFFWGGGKLGGGKGFLGGFVQF